MSNKEFTKEEIEELRKSKWILDVSPKSIHFSKEFKEEIYNKTINGQMSTRQAVAELGIDPNILGNTRIDGIGTTSRKKGKEGVFRDIRDAINIGNTNDENKRIRQLEHEVKYLKQELEFLKKMAFIAKEKNQKWQ